MPRIEPYTQQTSVSGIPGTPTVKPLAAGAEALQTFGEIGTRAATTMLERENATQQRLENEDAMARATDVLSQAHIDSAERLQQAQDAAPEGAPGFAKQAVADFDTYANKTAQAEPNRRAQLFLRERFASLRTSVAERAARYEAISSLELQKSSIDRGVSNTEKAAEYDEGQYGAALGDLHATIAASGLPASLKPQYVDAATARVSLAAARGVMLRNPNAALTLFNQALNVQPPPESAPADLDAEQQAAWGKLPENERATYTAVVRASKAGQSVTMLAPKVGQVPPRLVSSPAPTVDTGDVQTFALKPEQAAEQRQKTGVPYVDNLNLHDLLTLRSQADTAVRQDQGQARAGLERTLRDADALALTGQRYPVAPRPAEVASAFPKPEDAARYMQSWQASQAMADTAGRMKGLSDVDMAVAIESFAPKQGEGAADALHRQQQLIQIGNGIVAQRKADPASYVISNAVSVNRAYEDVKALTPMVPAGERQRVYDAYATATLGEQKRLGIAEPKLLTQPYVDQVTRSFLDQKDGAANSAGMIRDLATYWGPHWPAVYGQLSKHLPPAVKVLGMLGSDIDTATAELIARTATMKPDEFTDGLPTTSAGDVRKQYASLSVDLNQSLSWQPGGAETAAALSDTTQRLALTYVRQGMTPSDAATQAYTRLVGDRYTFEGPARIPKTFDSGAVMRGAANAVGGLESLDLVLPPAPKGMTPKDAKAAYVATLSDKPLWLTNAKETGLILYDRVSATPVRTRDGQPVEYGFADLLRSGGPGVLQRLNPFAKSPETGGATGEFDAGATGSW